MNKIEKCPWCSKSGYCVVTKMLCEEKNCGPLFLAIQEVRRHAINQERPKDKTSNEKDLREKEGGGSVLQEPEQGNDKGNTQDTKEIEKGDSLNG